MFLRYYLTDKEPSIQRCYDTVSSNFNGEVPNLSSFKRFLYTVPDSTLRIRSRSRGLKIQADATKWSPCSILKLIANSILDESCKGSSSDILDRLVNELTGTDRLIIIDEAQHLKARVFDTLRVLNDRAEVGVNYAGTPDVIDRMTIGRAKEDFDQVYSRIEYTCNLSNRFTIKEISSLFDAFNLDNTVIKCLCNAASQKGGLRYAIKLFKVANLAEQGNITVAAIEEAMKRVGKGAQFK